MTTGTIRKGESYHGLCTGCLSNGYEAQYGRRNVGQFEKKPTYLDTLHRIPAYTMQVYCQQKLEAKLQSLHKNFAGDVSTSCLSALHLRTCCHTQCTKNIELLCWMNLVLLQDANYDFIM